MSQLKGLVDIITSGVNEIEVAYAAASCVFPTLDDPWAPSALEDNLQPIADLVASAAFQLMTMLRKPPAVLSDAAMAMYTPAALNVTERAHVVEILREAGPQGMHVNDIADKSHINPQKLGPLLRLLSSRAIFREVSPDVFANNRMSSALDTGKTLQEIQLDPIEKYNGSNGMAALFATTVDECRRGSMYLSDHVFDPKTSFSDEPTASPFNAAYATEQGYFPWLANPGNEMRLKRFGAAMAGSRLMFPSDAILQGFEWNSVAKGDVVVDVGGGIGSTTLVLAKSFPDLKFFVQDFAATVADGIKYFDQELPGATTSGHVIFKAHDFFTPQPIQNAAVFLLRMITHDWPTPYVHQIMRHLRDAAAPSTRLIIVEFIIPYAGCATGALSHIPGAEVESVPEPLIPNLITSWYATNLSLQMMTVLNSQERTLGDFVDLGIHSGWKLDRVHRGPPGSLSQLVYTPA